MYLRVSFFAFFLSLNVICFCQHDLRRVNVSTLPEEIRGLKDVSVAMRWTDSTGDHVVVTTQTIYRPSDDIVLGRRERGLEGKAMSDFFKTQPPLTYLFTIKNDSADLEWKVMGNVKPCTVKSVGDKVKNSLVVTDLNADRIAEVWMIYKRICIDDESPSNMKITMYHGNKRHTLEGVRDFQNGDEIIKGRFTFDDAFKNALPAFVKYAEQLWKKNQVD